MMGSKQQLFWALASEPWAEAMKDPALSFVLFGIVLVYAAMALLHRSLR